MAHFVATSTLILPDHGNILISSASPKNLASPIAELLTIIVGCSSQETVSEFTSVTAVGDDVTWQYANDACEAI